MDANSFVTFCELREDLDLVLHAHSSSGNKLDGTTNKVDEVVSLWSHISSMHSRLTIEFEITFQPSSIF